MIRSRIYKVRDSLIKLQSQTHVTPVCSKTISLIFQPFSFFRYLMSIIMNSPNPPTLSSLNSPFFPLFANPGLGKTLESYHKYAI